MLRGSTLFWGGPSAAKSRALDRTFCHNGPKAANRAAHGAAPKELNVIAASAGVDTVPLRAKTAVLACFHGRSPCSVAWRGASGNDDGQTPAHLEPNMHPPSMLASAPAYHVKRGVWDPIVEEALKENTASGAGSRRIPFGSRPGPCHKQARGPGAKAISEITPFSDPAGFRHGSRSNTRKPQAKALAAKLEPVRIPSGSRS